MGVEVVENKGREHEARRQRRTEVRKERSLGIKAN
jgi:hypothetical protein